jgi:hypothetical protein
LCEALDHACPPAAAQTSSQRIVAVGDLHGDYDAWIAIARAAGLVDARNRWAGGSATLVQLGDITDRGPDSLRIIRHLRQLHREAPRSGGRVAVVLGNHEAMNVTGDLRYVHPGEYAAFADNESGKRRQQYFEQNRARIEKAYRARDPKLSANLLHQAWLKDTPLGLIEHRMAWAPDGELGRWAIGNPAVLKIGDTLFVHGGLAREYAAVPIAEINRRVAASLAAREEATSAIINDPLGPLWYRGLIIRDVAGKTGEEGQSAAPATLRDGQSRPAREQELTSVLAAHGARRLVVGHTPSPRGIVVEQNGRLVRVDTGISRHYGGRLSYVEIIGDRIVPHSIDRPAPRARQ